MTDVERIQNLADRAKALASSNFENMTDEQFALYSHMVNEIEDTVTELEKLVFSK